MKQQFAKKIIILSLITILSACSGGEIKKANPSFYKHQTAIGLNKISQTGNGQKIGVAESANFGGNKAVQDEYGKNYETGLKITYNSKTGSYNTANYNPTSSETPSGHPAMVSSLAVGKKYGIAKGSKLIPYSFHNVPDNYKSIFDDAKTKNLVAINNSFGVSDFKNALTKILDSTYYANLKKTPLSDAEKTAKTRLEGMADKNSHHQAELDALKARPQTDSASSLTVAQIADVREKQALQAMFYQLMQVNSKNIIKPKCSVLKYALEQKKAGYAVSTYNVYSGVTLQPTLKMLNLAKNLTCNGGYDSNLPDDFYKKELGTSLTNQLIADSKANKKDIPILVWATGNEKGDTAEDLASAPGKHLELEKYWLAVVNITSDYKLQKYSAKCGQAKNYCLGAIGEGSKSMNVDGSEQDGSGTSAASPQITAGLAIIKQKFPTKSNVWARARMLITARHTTADGHQLKDRSGNIVSPDSKGQSDEFGRGIMRLDLATKPVGYGGIAIDGTTVNDASQLAVDKSFVSSSSAIGDGLRNGFAGISGIIFDRMGATFKYNYATNINFSNPERIDLFNTTKPQKIHKNVGYASNQNNKPYANKNDIYFNYKFNKTTLSYITNKQSTNTLQVAKQHKNLNYGFGIMHENGTILGAKFAGAYKTKSLATTPFININYNKNINGYKLFAQSSYGITMTDSNDGIIKKIDNIHTFASSFKLSKDNWGIELNMPLRVIKSNAQIRYVYKTTKGINDNDKLHYKTENISFNPTGRQITIKSFYKLNNNLTLLGIINLDKNHIKNNNELISLINYKIKF